MILLGIVILTGCDSSSIGVTGSSPIVSDTSGLPPETNVNVNKSSIDFGTVLVNQKVDQTVTITNSSQTQASLIGSVGLNSIFNYKDGQFPGMGGNCEYYLAGGASCNIVLEYLPVANGSSSTLVNFTYLNDSNVGYFTIALAGAASAPQIIKIGAGSFTGCALYDSGAISCWGLVNNSVNTAATTIPGITDAIDFAIGGPNNRLCVLHSSFNVGCYSLGNDLTDSDPVGEYEWEDINYSNVAAIAMNGQGGCLLFFSGITTCWGTDPGSFNWTPAILPTAASDFALVAGNMSLAVNNSVNSASVGCLINAASGANLDCWVGSAGFVPTLNFAGISNATQVVSGQTHFCALVGGAVECAGDNYFGQSGPSSGVVGGNNSTRDNGAISTPIASGATQVVAGPNHSCAIVAGAVKCWGDGSYGQNGTNVPTANPQTVAGVTSATSLAAGTSWSCAQAGAHSVKCWGDQTFGWGTANPSALFSIINL